MYILYSICKSCWLCATVECLPSPTVWWTMLSSTFRPSVPKTPMAGEKPSWKAQPWMYESSPETFQHRKKIIFILHFTNSTDIFSLVANYKKSDQHLVVMLNVTGWSDPVRWCRGRILNLVFLWVFLLFFYSSGTKTFLKDFLIS